MLEYDEIIQQTLIDKINQRYQPSIEVFEKIGEIKICYLRDKFPSFSLITYFPILLAMISKGESVHLCRRISFCISYPILIMEEFDTVIEISARKGAKFYTTFTDESKLISKKNHSPLDKESSENIEFLYTSSILLEDAWKLHRDGMLQKTNATQLKSKKIKFDDYVSWRRQEDMNNQKSMFRAYAGFFLFLMTFVFVFIITFTIRRILPDLADWIRIILLIFNFLSPYIVLQWYKVWK